MISALITAYPAACSERNSFGQLPLHLACDFDSAHEILSTAEKSAKSEDNPINRLPETALKWSPSRRQSGVKGQMGLLNTDFEKVERNRVEVRRREKVELERRGCETRVTRMIAH